MHVVYFTSKTGNTRRFVEKLEIPNHQITKDLIMDQPFVLLTPTYADTSGRHSVPTPVIKFLNVKENRENMIGVVGFGNRNFGRFFAIASEVISLKCNVPLLHKVELFGTADDVRIVQESIFNEFNRLHCT